MILSDREITIALDSGQLIINPRPDAVAFSSTSIDLTLADSGFGWEIEKEMAILTMRKQRLLETGGQSAA